MCVGNTNRLLALVARQESEENIPGNIDVVNQARHTLEAVHLVKLGARASLVCKLTGLTKKVVSGLYPQLTGMSSPPGQVPFTDTWYLKSNRRLLHANLVWRLFQHLENIQRTAAKVLIHVYEAYMGIVDTPLLNLTRAFFVPRLVRIKAWYEQTCDHCSMSYIGPPGNTGSTCPACTEYFNHRCRSCGAALEYRPMGRRKVVCSECHEHQRRKKKRPTCGGIDG
ncbi:MAG: FlhC family transcriptional regulator [Candidatus Thiodiazotropha endolucinida]